MSFLGGVNRSTRILYRKGPDIRLEGCVQHLSLTLFAEVTRNVGEEVMLSVENPKLLCPPLPPAQPALCTTADPIALLYPILIKKYF